MAGRDEDETDFHTTQEESMRQAEAAFGGASDAPALPGLGAGPSSPAPRSAPAPAPSPAAVRPSAGGLPPTGPAAPGRVLGAPPRRRRVAGRGIALVVVLGVVAALAGGIYALVDSVGNTVDKVRSSPAFSVPSVPGIPSVPTPSPGEPAAGASYFTIGGLAAARAKAQSLAGPGARIQLARIADGQLQVIARNGTRGRVILISPGMTRRIDTPSGASTGNEFRFAALRPGAVGRITAALSRRFHVSRGEIDYMVVLRDPIGKGVEWLVYPRGGSGHFQANAAGGGLRRVG